MPRNVIGDRDRLVVVLVGALLVVAFSVGVGAAPLTPPAPNSGWLLDEGSGTRLWEWTGDGTGRLGAQGGATAPTWSTATPFSYPGNHSLEMTGTGVNVASGWARISGHPTGTTGTIAFWVTDDGQGKYMMDATGGHRTLMYRLGGGTTEDFGTYLNNSSIGNVSGALVPDNGQWTHVAMTWDTSLATAKQKIYRNGTLFDTKNVAVSARNPAEFFLGSRYGLTESWGGKMDEFGVWNKALSGDEVQWLASNSLRAIPYSPPPPPVPASGWLLDEGSGSQLAQWNGPRTGELGGHTGVPAPTWSTDTPFSYSGNTSLQFQGTGVGVPSNWSRLDGHSSATKGTVAFWVYDEDGLSPHYVLDGTNGHRTLMYRTSGLSTYLNQSSLGTAPGNLVPVGEWTHVAISWDNSRPAEKQMVYKNGELFWTSNVTVGARNPADVFLGSRFSRNEGWQGRIDEYGLWNTALSRSQIQWLATHSLGSIPTQYPAFPVASWLFDEGAGSNARPFTGADHGTLHSNVGWTTSTPHATYSGNHALYFDGTSDNRVNFPGRHFGTEGSIQVWVYHDDATGTQYVMDSSGGARTLLYGGWSLFLNNQHLGGMSGELIPMNEWTHLVVTWDNDLLDGMREKVYKNGALFAYFDNVLNPTDPAMLWLGNRYSNNEPWKGAIDEYALWDHALTPQEIGWLYQHSITEIIPEPGTLALLGLGALALARRRRRRT